MLAGLLAAAAGEGLRAPARGEDRGAGRSPPSTTTFYRTSSPNLWQAAALLVRLAFIVMV